MAHRSCSDLWLCMNIASRGRWRGCLLLSRRCRRSIFLRVSDKLLDEIHVLRDNLSVHAFPFELMEKSRPGRVDVGRYKALLCVVAHVCDVDKGVGLRSRDHRFVDLSSLTGLLLLA